MLIFLKLHCLQHFKVSLKHKTIHSGISCSLWCEVKSDTSTIQVYGGGSQIRMISESLSSLTDLELRIKANKVFPMIIQKSMTKFENDLFKLKTDFFPPSNHYFFVSFWKMLAVYIQFQDTSASCVARQTTRAQAGFYLTTPG